MKLIKPTYEIIPQKNGLDGIYEMIEKAGRTCYKSEDKITTGSAKKFVDMMVKSGHGAMLEHGTVYLKIEVKVDNLEDVWRVNKYRDNRFSFVRKEMDGNFHNIYFITTNYRVIIENDWLDDLKYICDPTDLHEKRITVKFICDRGILAEFTRHRVFSFAAESTRYCNYSKDKFNNELTFIIPEWMNINEGQCYYQDGMGFREGANLNEGNWGYIERNTDKQYQFFLDILYKSEMAYFNLLKQWEEKTPDKRYKSGFKGNPWTPQQARAVLPNALKTELIMTGFVSDWEHFFELRCDKAAHPQARELAIPLQKEFIKLNLI